MRESANSLRSRDGDDWQGKGMFETPIPDRPCRWAILGSVSFAASRHSDWLWDDLYRYIIVCQWKTTFHESISNEIYKIGIAFATPTGKYSLFKRNRYDQHLGWGDEQLWTNSKCHLVLTCSEMQERQWGQTLAQWCRNCGYKAGVGTSGQVLGSSTWFWGPGRGMHNLDFQYIRAHSYSPYPCERPEEIVGDFLAKSVWLFSRGKWQTLVLRPELRDRLPVDIVVTSPAVCLVWHWNAKVTKFHI